MSKALANLLDSPDFPEGSAWTRQEYAAGAVIFHEGDADHKVFLILRGTVSVNKATKLETGKEIRPGVSELTAGETFGELHLFAEHGRSASVSAVSDVELASIDAPTLREYMERNPEIGFHILKDFFIAGAEKLRRSDARVGKLFAWGLHEAGLDQDLGDG